MITKWMIPIQLDQKLLSLSEPLKRDSQNGSKKLNLTRIIPKKELPIPKKGNAKECSQYCTIALISHTSKVMLKILQARLQKYMDCELPDIQAEFRKWRGTKDRIANIHWIIKKQEFQENIYFCFIDYAKAFNCLITANWGKFLKRWE